jgi:hypothetical protein
VTAEPDTHLTASTWVLTDPDTGSYHCRTCGHDVCAICSDCECPGSNCDCRYAEE